MLAAIREALALREETVELGGQKLIVRELSQAAVTGGKKDDPDNFYHLMIACVFDESGKPALEESDIPELKASSRKKLEPLTLALARVNGLDTSDAAKNSDADQT